MSVNSLQDTTLGDEVMDDLEVAVAFTHTIIWGDDITYAMRYASPNFQIRYAPSTPHRSPLVGAEGLRKLREDIDALCLFEGEPVTEYYLARPGLVVGKISRPARLRSSGEPFDFRRTEWITVQNGLVSDIEVFYFENAPLARCAEDLHLGAS